MNDLVKLTYDVFSHVIPGMVIFFSVTLLYAPIAPDELFAWLETNAKIEAGESSVIIIVSYIIGFAVNPFGKYVYQNLGKILWPKKEKEKKDGDQQKPKKGEESEENKEEQAKEQQAKQQEPVECMCGICKLGKRQWVGLTDEDIDNIELPPNGTATVRDFIRLIEAKLKEKNEKN